MTKIFYSPSYALSKHSFSTTRKSASIARLLQEHPIPGIDLVAPESATEAQVLNVHDARYLQALRTGKPRHLATPQGFGWDAGVWPVVLASTGGVIAAALTARREGVSGSLSSGLHHARRGSGSGFCSVAGLSLAALAAIEDGCQAVLQFDNDSHGGGGDHSLISENPRIWHSDVVVSPFDCYEPGLRERLSVVHDAAEYLPTIQDHLDDLEANAPHFDLCLYNAGMDVHQRCLIGGLKGITADILRQREEMVFAWCRRRGIPIAFVLAGGYEGGKLTQENLVDLHRLTIAEAAKGWPSPPGSFVDGDLADGRVGTEIGCGR